MPSDDESLHREVERAIGIQFRKVAPETLIKSYVGEASRMSSVVEWSEIAWEIARLKSLKKYFLQQLKTLPA